MPSPHRRALVVGQLLSRRWRPRYTILLLLCTCRYAPVPFNSVGFNTRPSSVIITATRRRGGVAPPLSDKCTGYLFAVGPRPAGPPISFYLYIICYIVYIYTIPLYVYIYVMYIYISVHIYLPAVSHTLFYAYTWVSAAVHCRWIFTSVYMRIPTLQ